jgi:membrane associated rhomboid family serine protease
VPPSETAEAPEQLDCYRHPGRETLIRCSNCERPICTACMTQAAVGIRCPECAGGRRGLGAVAPRASGALESARRNATATTVIVAVNVLVFLGELAQGIGISGTGGSSVVSDGGLTGAAVADGEWWRLVTSAFIHAGLLHVAFNMYALWWLGGILERDIGTLRFLGIYFASVLGGAAGALIASPDALTVGASGGVFGLLAAMLVIERQRGVSLMQSPVGALLVANLVITFVLPGISLGGHLGGIVGGAAAALILSGFGARSISHARFNPLVAAGMLGLGAVAVVVALAAA